MENFIHWNPNPVFFTLPLMNWPVRWYGISWALAFFLSSLVMGKIFKAENRSSSQLDSLTLYMMISTLLGARLGHCFFYDPGRYLLNPLEILKIWEGGLASHGAAIGIIVGIWLYCRKFHENLGWLYDRIVVVVPLASSMIRFGNFMNSEIVGKVTDVPWAIVFEKVDSSPRHPGQLYEAFIYLFIFFFVNWLWKRKRDRLGRGFLFGFVCLTMFGSRFFIEFLKENQSEFEGGWFLNLGQLLSIPLIILGIYLIRSSGNPSTLQNSNLKKGKRAG